MLEQSSEYEKGSGQREGELQGLKKVISTVEQAEMNAKAYLDDFMNIDATTQPSLESTLACCMEGKKMSQSIQELLDQAESILDELGLGGL